VVLRPIGSGRDAQTCVPVWDAIFPTQKTNAPEYWLITQPEHARLSGAIAAALGPPLLPRLSPVVVQGIAAHDDGWAPFDARLPVADGRPLSFLNFPPRDFLCAWRGSIECAEKIAHSAGAIVSGHFWRLAKNRLEWGIDDADDCRLLSEFLQGEQARQQRLLAGCSWEEFEFQTDVLQFCDVLSLYLCCGAAQDVEFTQQFRQNRVRLHREDARRPEQAAVCRFEPSPFTSGGVDLAVVARRFPADRPGTVTLPFRLY
jgi:hypothetical protein